MTQYERIRNMTIEEMAEFLEKNGSDKFHEKTDGYQCRACHLRINGKCELADDDLCPFMDTYGVKQWLESEVRKIER